MKPLDLAETIGPAEKELLREIKEQVNLLQPGSMVILYGSQARGTADPESDWDLLIITPQPIARADEDELRHALCDAELGHDVVISSAIYSQGQWDGPLNLASPYRREVAQDGVIL